MSKWRKKPVVIDAVQITEDNDEEMLSFFEEFTVPFEVTDAYTLVIQTLEGDMTLSPGDWLIRGVKGEFYPCKPDIFDATYEDADAAEYAQQELEEDAWMRGYDHGFEDGRERGHDEGLEDARRSI